MMSSSPSSPNACIFTKLHRGLRKRGWGWGGEDPPSGPAPPASPGPPALCSFEMQTSRGQGAGAPERRGVVVGWADHREWGAQPCWLIPPGKRKWSLPAQDRGTVGGTGKQAAAGRGSDAGRDVRPFPPPASASFRPWALEAAEVCTRESCRAWLSPHSQPGPGLQGPLHRIVCRAWGKLGSKRYWACEQAGAATPSLATK
ncbi:hypothetical protein H8958_006440 [Nasalis larvatus]